MACRSIRKPTTASVLVLAGLLAGVGAVAARAAPSEIDWLAEAICETRKSHARDHAADDAAMPLALIRHCEVSRLRGPYDRVAFQRHDWPAAQERRQRAQGYQRSQSYWEPHGGGAGRVVQTFDFGGGQRAFGRFDEGAGDGGQIVRLRGGTAVVTMTEDGTGGVQWFIGGACRDAADEARSGWVLFGPERAGVWTSTVAALRRAGGSGECPARFDASYTRWRQQFMDWPVLFDGQTREDMASLPAVDTILSEHFGGASIAGASHMERFYLGRGMGLIRWERWEQAERSRRPDLRQRAERLARSERCPEVALDAAPGEGWLRTDCRTWTNFVSTPADARAFGWPQQEGREP